MPICKLCLDNEGSRNSHILSEFMFSHMYDDKHRFQVGKVHAIAKGRKTRPIQKALREQNLFCGDCEQILGKYENCASAILTQNRNFTESESLDQKFSKRKWEKIDYLNFKLFILSLFWRMSVTRLKNWKYVDLGKDHNEAIRKILFKSDSLNEFTYPISILDGRPHLTKYADFLITKSSEYKQKGKLIQLFFYKRLFFRLILGPSGKEDEEAPYYLKENGTINLIEISKQDARKTMDSLFDIPEGHTLKISTTELFHNIFRVE